MGAKIDSNELNRLIDSRLTKEENNFELTIKSGTVEDLLRSEYLNINDTTYIRQDKAIKIMEAFVAEKVYPVTDKLIRGIYKKPFKYDEHGQMIFDANNEHVVDVRGWSHLQNMEKQDKFGEFLTGLLNKFYDEL